MAKIEDTLNLLKRLLRPLMNERGEIDFAGEDVSVELPATLTAEQDFAGFKTVGDLAKGFTEAKGKAASVGTLESIPEEVRKDPNIAKYKSLEELAKGHLETVKLVGRKGVIVPTENATPEEKAAFFNSIGRPEKADGYKLTPVENLHKSVQITPESSKAYFDVAHRLGLTQAQADGLNKWYLESVSGGLAKQDQATEAMANEAATKLRQEWGPDFGVNLARANKLIQKFGGKDGTAAFGDLGNNPAVLKVLASIGKKMSEDTIRLGGVPDLEQTPETAKQQIVEINKKIQATSQDAPEYQGLLKQKKELYDIAYPSETSG